MAHPPSRRGQVIDLVVAKLAAAIGGIGLEASFLNGPQRQQVRAIAWAAETSQLWLAEEEPGRFGRDPPPNRFKIDADPNRAPQARVRAARHGHRKRPAARMSQRRDGPRGRPNP
jgi:hypothetical protein